MIILIIYMVLGYWATGKTIYANHILIGTENGIFWKKIVHGISAWLGINSVGDNKIVYRRIKNAYEW